MIRMSNLNRFLIHIIIYNHSVSIGFLQLLTKTIVSTKAYILGKLKFTTQWVLKLLDICHNDIFLYHYYIYFKGNIKRVI